MQPQTFVFFGIVGSGKGTQVDLLRKYLENKKMASDILYTSTGVEFRKIMESGSYTGQLVKETLEKGFLQPNFITTSLFTNILISGMQEETCLIADGYPRTILQAESFEAMVKLFILNYRKQRPPKGLGFADGTTILIRVSGRDLTNMSTTSFPR